VHTGLGTETGISRTKGNLTPLNFNGNWCEKEVPVRFDNIILRTYTVLRKAAHLHTFRIILHWRSMRRKWN